MSRHNTNRYGHGINWGWALGSRVVVVMRIHVAVSFCKWSWRVSRDGERETERISSLDPGAGVSLIGLSSSATPWFRPCVASTSFVSENNRVSTHLSAPAETLASDPDVRELCDNVAIAIPLFSPRLVLGLGAQKRRHYFFFLNWIARAGSENDSRKKKKNNIVEAIKMCVLLESDSPLRNDDLSRRQQDMCLELF